MVFSVHYPAWFYTAFVMTFKWFPRQHCFYVFVDWHLNCYNWSRFFVPNSVLLFVYLFRVWYPLMLWCFKVFDFIDIEMGSRRLCFVLLCWNCLKLFQKCNIIIEYNFEMIFFRIWMALSDRWFQMFLFLRFYDPNVIRKCFKYILAILFLQLINGFIWKPFHG